MRSSSPTILPDLDLQATSRAHGNAAAAGRSKSYYLRELVTAGIDDLEYAYGLIARAIRAGHRETRPLGDQMSELGVTREELDATADQPA